MANTDWLKPTTTSNYSSEFIQQLDLRLKDLAFGLDPTYTTVTAGLVTGMVRLNRTSTDFTFDTYNGSTWSVLAKRLGMEAATASALSTSRTISATGDAAWSVSFNGSANTTADITLASITTATTLGSATVIPIVAINAKGLVTSLSSVTITNSFTDSTLSAPLLTLQTGTGVTTLARLQANAAGTIMYLGDGTTVRSFSADNLASTLLNKTLDTGCSLSTAVSATTRAVDTAGTGIATLDFVLNQASVTNPSMSGTASYGTGTRFARSNHVHPTDTSRAPLNAPTFTGTVSITSLVSGATIQAISDVYGGRLSYAKSNTSTLAGPVVTDACVQSFRIFENGGTSRGVQVDLLGCGINASSYLIHSDNIATYAPGKTGSGASGTGWAISITGSSTSCTGNSATATNATYSNNASAAWYSAPLAGKMIQYDYAHSVEVRNVSSGTGANNSNMAAIGFHCQGAYGIELGLRPDNYFGLGGWSSSAWKWYVDPAGNCTATNFTATSDPKLKQDFEVIPNALASVKRLNGSRFTWKTGPEHNKGKEGTNRLPRTNWLHYKLRRTEL